VRDKTLVLSRGLPGSGKSTLARFLTDAAFAADDFFEQDGDYAFDFSRLREAHEWCQKQTEEAMGRGEPLVAVHNTFSRRWEAEQYFDLAQKYGYSVFVVESQSMFGNVHGVPESAIETMRLRWESLTLDPLPWWKVLRYRLREEKYSLKRKLFGWLRRSG